MSSSVFVWVASGFWDSGTMPWVAWTGLLGLLVLVAGYHVYLRRQQGKLEEALRALNSGNRSYRTGFVSGPLGRIGLALDEFASAMEERLTAADAAQGEYERLTLSDTLTGIGNRQHFDHQIELVAARGRRYQLPESVILCEIDHFSAICLAHGSAAAESLLVAATNRIIGKLRDSDSMMLYREGQLAIITPCLPLAAAQTVAEQVAQVVRERPFAVVGLITLSAGIAQLLPGERAKHWVLRAEQQLERARQNGRNRVLSNAELAPHATGDYLVFGEHLATGISPIDREHAELFRLAQTLARLPADCPRNLYFNHVDALCHHLERHFEHEEQVLLDEGCPGQQLNAHATVHQGLLVQTSDLLARLRRGEIDVDFVTDFFVRTVTVGHLVNVDLPLFSSLTPSAVLPTAGAAARPSSRVKRERARAG